MNPQTVARNAAAKAAAFARRERERLRALAAAHADYMDALRASGLTRPRTRAECVDGPRPCPWVSCRHHLALDPDPRPNRAPYVLSDPDTWTPDTPTCSLDLAEGAGAQGATSYHMTLEAVGALLDVSRQRVQQVEERALAKLAAATEGILRPFLTPSLQPQLDPRAERARIILGGRRKQP